MEPKDFLPIVILIGVLVNLYISYINFRSSKKLEALKSALSFREHAIDRLSKVQAELSVNIDMSSATKAIHENDGKAAAEFMKQEREEYMKVYNLHSTIRHLFDTDLRIKFDNKKKVADKLDGEAYRLLLDWGSKEDDKGKAAFNTASQDFFKAAIEYKRFFRKAIEDTLVQYSDDLRKHIVA